MPNTKLTRVSLEDEGDAWRVIEIYDRPDLGPGGEDLVLTYHDTLLAALAHVARLAGARVLS